jgi:hypothetical protein
VGVFKDDMYVELRIVGMPHDMATQGSPHKNNTGRLVVDQDFSFPVKFPEMAVLLVLLKDHDDVMTDTILGYAGIPLASLAPGECGIWQASGVFGRFGLGWAVGFPGVLGS